MLAGAEAGHVDRGGGCTREGVEHAPAFVVEDVDAAVLVAGGGEAAVDGLGDLRYQWGVVLRG